MSSFQIDSFDNDLDVTNNEVTLTDGQGAIAQHMQARFRTFLGEWFLDETIGVPYYQEILVKQPNFPLVQSVLKATATETVGITELTKFEFDFTGVDRELQLEIAAMSEEGPIDFSQIVEV